MCTGASLLVPIFSAVVSGFLNKPKDSAPAVPAPAAPPAPSVTPDQDVMKKKIASAAGDPTALTGPGGIADFGNSLGGKSTLLGS